MPESPIVVSLKEFAEILIRERNIREGNWGPYFRFGLNVANMNVEYPEGTNVMVPSALVPLLEIGIQRFPEPTALSIDAAKVNPKPTRSRKGSKPSPTKARKK